MLYFSLCGCFQQVPTETTPMVSSEPAKAEAPVPIEEKPLEAPASAPEPAQEKVPAEPAAQPTEKTDKPPTDDSDHQSEKVTPGNGSRHHRV